MKKNPSPSPTPHHKNLKSKAGISKSKKCPLLRAFFFSNCVVGDFENFQR
jgi:hypothetical protein